MPLNSLKYNKSNKLLFYFDLLIFFFTKWKADTTEWSMFSEAWNAYRKVHVNNNNKEGWNQ